MLPETKNLNHSERLKRYKLPTLRYRSIQGDMIETSKILSGKYDTLPSSTLTVVGPTSTYNKVTKIELNTKGDQKVMQLRYKKTQTFSHTVIFPYSLLQLQCIFPVICQAVYPEKVFSPAFRTTLQQQVSAIH